MSPILKVEKTRPAIGLSEGKGEVCHVYAFAKGALDFASSEPEDYKPVQQKRDTPLTNFILTALRSK